MRAERRVLTGVCRTRGPLRARPAARGAGHRAVAGKEPEPGTRGQALVEFAVVLPLLLLLLLGLLDVGRAVAADVALTDAAREGAHYSILHDTGECHWDATMGAPSGVCADVLAAALRVAPQVQTAAVTGIDVVYAPVPASAGDAGTPGVRVMLRYRFAPVTGLILGGATLPLSATGISLAQDAIQ